MSTSRDRTSSRTAFVAAHVLLLAGLSACAASDSASNSQMTFDSPTAAVHRLGEVAATGDTEATDALFGEGGLELLRSGDDVADQDDARHVRDLIRQKLAFEERDDGSTIALIGHDAWPLPIPLVEEDGKWRFDTEAGLDELENRRVGRNELSTIATLHAYVDAQREYASMERDGIPASYARRVFSTPGKHDGLYWPANEGEPESPLGPLVADAADDGYVRAADEPQPFHGYRFRVLTAQGKNAPGGARDYLDEHGRMTRGFALLAWPVKYGSSGVMTFQVDHRGIVYQKDLGAGTDGAVAAIKAFDVDASWNPTGD